MKILRLPKRALVKTPDTWDLSKLFPNDKAWDEALTKLEKRIKGYDKFRDTLGKSAADLAACLKYDGDTERLADRLSNYAYLKTAEDQANSTYQRMLGRIRNISTRVSEASSFIQPEVMAIPDAKMRTFLANSAMAKYRLLVERILRFKPYTLGKNEERLLAMQGEIAGTPSVVFRQLHDADLKFGLVKDESGQQIELSPSTLAKLMQSPSRDVRRTTFQHDGKGTRLIGESDLLTTVIEDAYLALENIVQISAVLLVFRIQLRELRE